MDGIELLKQDHGKIIELFLELESTDKPQELEDYFDKLANLLTLHARTEELVLYPQSRNCENTVELINEGHKEHAKSDLMVLALKSISSNEAEFKEKVSELEDFMLHHLDEEENELFPKIRQCLSDETLQQLGNQITETKTNLQSRKLIKLDNKQMSRVALIYTTI